MPKMKKENLYIAGMFRSGTTLVARMLGNHKNVACASDAYLPIYKEIRNKVRRSTSENCKHYTDNDPFSDYYFDIENNNIYKNIQEFKPSKEIIEDRTLQDLKRKIHTYALPYSQKLAKEIDRLEGRTFEEVLRNAYQLVNNIYGDDESLIVATKEVWTNEFNITLQKSNIVDKVIHIVRDPRAVIASNIASGQAYPLIFSLRQWRKIAGIAIRSRQLENQELLKYEDLVNDKEEISNKLCNFLDIDYDSSMICEETFKDGEGKPWKRNTSYKNKASNRIQASNDWVEILSKKQVMFIEKYAHKEMRLLGYKPLNSKYPERIGYTEENMQYANWIQQYSNYNWENEEEKENNRLGLINLGDNISDKEIRYNFIDNDIYQCLRGRQ